MATLEQNLRTLHKIEERLATPPDDSEDGDEGCDHKWNYQGQAKDGTPFYRCIVCGAEEEG
jgi:hypothetical protein